MQFTLYALPALLALLLKAGLFFYARFSNIHNLQTRIYLLFLFCMAIQNLAELRFFLFKAIGSIEPPEFEGRIYFSASILAIAALLHLALILGTNRSASDRNFRATGLSLIYAPAILLEVVLWSGPLLVVGFKPIEYTYTKIPGSLYFLWELYAVSYLCGAGSAFVYGALKQTTPFRRLQNKFLLTGIVPILVIVLSVLGLQHFGLFFFNTTATLPLATTFFLAMTAYATHQYRLFDIAFFMPWSKIRKRKTMFYQRIQTTIAEISQLDSVKEIVRLLSETLRCPVALIGGSAQPILTMSGDHVAMARFPLDELKKIDRIVVANEIAEAAPALHAQMQRHRIAAVVPFYPRSQSTASWMMLGESFNEQVYTPLDFRVVEELFNRIADRFLDRQLLLNSQIDEAHEEMDLLRRRLALSWDQSTTLHRELTTARNKLDELQKRLVERDGKLSAAQQEIGVLREKREALRARLLREQLRVVQPVDGASAETPGPTFDDHVAEFESWLIRQTLKHYDGDRAATAHELGLRLSALQSKIERYGLEKEDNDAGDDDAE